MLHSPPSVLPPLLPLLPTFFQLLGTCLYNVRYAVTNRSPSAVLSIYGPLTVDLTAGSIANLALSGAENATVSGEHLDTLLCRYDCTRFAFLMLLLVRRRERYGQR